MFLLLVTRLAWAGCESVTTPEQLDGTLEEALLAYVALDEEGFVALAGRARAELGCVGVRLAPAQVAAYDRVVGLHRFVEGDTSGASAAFKAARSLDRAYVFSDRIAPEGGKLERLYMDAVKGPASRAERLDVASAYRMWVDGTETTRRPTEVPTVVQVGAGVEDVGFTTVLTPGERYAPPAPYAGAPQPAEEDEPEPAKIVTPVAAREPEREPERAPVREAVREPLPTKPRPERREEPDGGGATGWWVATAASAVAAGGLFGAAVVTNQQFAETPSEDAWILNHASYYGSLGMAGVTLAFAGIAIGGSF